MPTTTVEPKLDENAQKAHATLESKIQGVRSRNRVKFLGTGLCLGLVVFIGAFLGFSIADIVFKLSVGARLFAFGAALAGMGAMLFWYTVRPWRSLGGAVQSARTVESAYPQLEEQLSTALEYGRDSKLAFSSSSPELVGALMQQAAQKSDPLDFARTIRWRPLAIAALAAFLLAAGMAAYRNSHKRLFDTTFSRFFQPTSELPAPTLTMIKSVEVQTQHDNKVEWQAAGNTEVPVEQSVALRVIAEDNLPDTGTLSVFIPDEKNGRWEDRPMDRGANGEYQATLHRLLENTKYKVRVNDAESPEYQIEVYRNPEISDFTVRLEYPAYTQRSSETLAPGQGDVRALKGTTVHLNVTANTKLAAAALNFKSGKSVAGAIATPAAESSDISPAAAAAKHDTELRKSELTFKIETDDDYQIKITDQRGHYASSSQYLVKALKDYPPKVAIRTPDKDLMVHREQTVNVEITAEDDVGVAEIGLFHSLGVDESKVMIKKLDPPAIRTDGKLVWELGTMGLKGGEVIAYYAYALDNDKVDGPKMAKSDIHFLTVYDEQDYNSPQDPGKKKPPTPPAIKQLDKLIDAQKKILKDTFAQARQRDSALKSITDAEKAAALKTAEGQKALRAKVQDLLDSVRKELAQAEQNPPPDGQKPPGALGEKELKHVETAIEKMSAAEDRLKVPNTPEAVHPETEALRHLSETRRLILSDKEGDPRFKMAMNKQSKKKKQQEQDQQQKDQQQAKQELTEMPKMLEREKKVERDLEELHARKKKNPPPPAGDPQTADQKKEQDEQRRLQREQQDELEKLAKEAEDRARKLDQLAARNPDMQPAADKMQQAADKLKKAAEDAKKQGEQNTQNAKDNAHQATNETRDSHRNLRDAMEKQVRQELANLQKDAQDLAQRQQDLAQQARQAQQQQEGSKPESGQPQQAGKPQQGEQPGKPQQGEQAGKPQPGGKPDQAGKPQPGGQPQPGAEQQMRAMAGAQGEIQNDLKDLAERMQSVAQHANEKGLGGAPQLDKATDQARSDSPAGQSAQKAQEAMRNGKGDDAQREAAKSAKAMEQLASTLQEAVQKTNAADMKEMAGAMKKLQDALKEQGAINKGLAQKDDPGQLGDRQEKVGETAKELAGAAEKMEVLRQTGQQTSTRDKLNEAADKAQQAAQAMKGQDTATAKAPAEKAEQSLNQAMAEMERAAGKSLEEKAREAKAMAKAARENQEKAAGAIKDVPEPKPDEKLGADAAAKREEATAKENEAARDAKRLDHALEGLQEMAKEANPAAAAAAQEAKDISQQAELPKSMDDLSKAMQQIGEPKKPGEKNTAPTPNEANKKGTELAQTVAKIEKGLDAFVAEAQNSQLDRLRAMEQAAREAAQKAKALAENDPKAANPQEKPNDQKNNEAKNPNGQKNPNDTKNPADTKTASNDSKNPSDQKNPDAKPSDDGKPNENTADAAKQLEKDLKRLQPKIERLGENAPELKKLRDALAELQKAKSDQEDPRNTAKATGGKGEKNNGGPAFKHAHQAMDDVVEGLVGRIERILKAREVRPDEDEGAPKEYQTLVDRYYRALSEDVEEKKN